MKRKWLLAGFTSLCLACSAVGLAACAPDTPDVQEGALYQTEVETFWMGIGKAYFSFDYVEEPEAPEEGALYGYVFHLIADSGDGYSTWLSGSWELSEDESCLTLTATWEEGENATYLADATSGQAKTYSASNGAFVIGVHFPSAGTVDFTLDLENDKVTEGETPKPEPKPEPEPEPEPKPEPGEALYTSNEESIYAGQGSAYLALEEGGVFNVYVTYGGTTSSWVSGTWSMENEVLTVTPSDGSAISCALKDKAYTVNLSIPGAEIAFIIDMNEDSVTYTVNYMLNDGSGKVYSTAQIKGDPQEAYIAAAPAAPAREGYHFAGWQTKAEIDEADIVNGVSKYMWFFGDKLSPMGVTKFNGMSAEEREARKISEGRMLLDPVDEDGVVTLYARWVQEKEISTPGQLKDIGKDLYGAYKLTADITLTDEWEPIGAYFSNYEYYNTEWWTYAFRGSLNGNGHTISGLTITSAELNKNYSAEGSVWFDDGVTCDGTAAMFGALAAASISDITFENAAIDLTYSGDYLYIGVLASFDMASSLNDIRVNGCRIAATFDESELIFRTNLYTAVGGLVAGGWNDKITGCEVSGSISLNTANKAVHGGEIYFGGMVGENYSTMSGCKVDAELVLKHEDQSTVSEDHSLTVNVGGLSGSGTDISGCTIDADITVKVVKEHGGSSVNVGGAIGSQRYMVANKNTVTAVIDTSDTSLDEEEGALNVGGVAGRIDVYYTLQILAYTPIIEAGARENVQNVMVNGVATDVVIADAVSVIPGCWYIAKGDHPDYGATSNIDQVIEAYGSYLPFDSLQDGIIFIVNSSSEAE